MILSHQVSYVKQYFAASHSSDILHIVCLIKFNEFSFVLESVSFIIYLFINL